MQMGTTVAYVSMRRAYQLWEKFTWLWFRNIVKQFYIATIYRTRVSVIIT